MLKLLLAEDDLDLAQTLVQYLELEGFICDHVSNGIAGLNLIEQNSYDVLLLDINMPRLDGLGLCQRLREQGNDTPVLMLTARAQLDDKLQGFNAGTDDYLVKPFEMEELLARVRALSHRRSSQIQKLTCGDLQMNLSEKSVQRNGQALKLSPTSWRLLERLMRASPSPVSREELMDSAWGMTTPIATASRFIFITYARPLMAPFLSRCCIPSAEPALLSKLPEQTMQMFRFRISLRAVLIASFVALGLILVAAYTLVAKEHFIRGLDAAMAGNMEKAARTFSEVIGAGESEQVREFSGFDVATQWSGMPDYALRAFPNGPGKSGQLLKQEDSAWFSRPKSIVFAMRDDTAHGPLYLSQKVTPRQASEVLPQASRQNRVFTLTVSMLVIGFVSIVGWLLLWHVSRPMAALRAWTHSLDNDKLSDPVPDFSYPELNEMAELIRNSLSSVQQAVDRERRFLRHASHELRTPISTIRSNIELHRKLTQTREKLADEQSIVDRIDRASLTMKHLTETLLWLNHEPDTPLQSEAVDLPALIRELAAEMSYLLAGKPVTIEISTTPLSCTVPLVPARIILGNLIRNAYQHCWEGIVVIEQQGSRISISNPVELEGPIGYTKTAENTGYGLGLELTTKLSQRIGWHYTSSRHDNLHCVTVEIGTRLDN